MDIRLAGETISQGELNSVGDWMKSGAQLTKGPATQQFEAEFAAQVGARRAVFVNSGSSANLLAVAVAKESGRLKNLRALCPAVSWVTTVTPFLQLGFDVQLVDADAEDLGVDLDDLESKIIDHDPSILILVHVLGHANKMEQIVALCEKYDVFLIEDSCEALGSTVPSGDWLGTLGDIGTYSFYYGHHISTIEGGMAVTDSDDLYELMLSLRSHGWARDISESRRNELAAQWNIDDFSNYYTFYFEGFNFRSTDLQAQLGISQLKKVSSITDRREENFRLYQSLLPDYWSQRSDSGRTSSFAFGTFVEDRLSLWRELESHGIESRPLICGNIGRHPFWLRNHQEFSAPVADLVHSRGIYLPNHVDLSFDDIQKICSVVDRFASPVDVSLHLANWRNSE